MSSLDLSFQMLSIFLSILTLFFLLVVQGMWSCELRDSTWVGVWDCLLHLPMDFSISLFLVFVSLPAILAQGATHASIIVDGAAVVAETDDNYICATIDWWPHDKCNYNRCPWGYSSAVNLVRIWYSASSMFE